MHEQFTLSNEPTKAKLESTRWLFVSNQRNLLYMLAAGLIMPPKGFGKKYYQDTLAAFPGWIPLFPDNIPAASIEQSVSERSHLLPCLAEISLSSLRGTVQAIDDDGKKRDVKFPYEIDGSERVILIPAPLPTTWIESIIFQSRDDMTSCNSDALDFANVPLSDFNLQAGAQHLPRTTDMTWPPENIDLSNQDKSMSVPLAAGGMMAMLMHFANLGDIGIKACHLAFDAEKDVATTITDPIISALGEWECIGQTPNTDDVLKKLFWGVIDKLIVWQSSDASGSALDVLLEHLEVTASQLDERLKQALIRLAGDLKTVADFADSTITELFERHPKSFSRVMTLFFLREDCAELLEFKHPLLTETDYLAAAILFAAREGWLQLPLELRDIPGLQEAVPHRMAAIAHRSANTGIELGTPPARPMPLRELFIPTVKRWVKAQNEAALMLTQECKWSGIQTRITLDKGNYRLDVDGRGMHILIDGEAKAVVTEVDMELFFENLARQRITGEQEKMIRDILKT